MIEYTFNQLSKKEKYNLLIGSVIPRPVLFLTSMDSKGIVNVAPFSFFNMISYDPAILMVSIQRKKGQMKRTAHNIISNSQAVGHILSHDILEEINKTAQSVPCGKSKMALTNLNLVASKRVSVPRVAQAKIAYEVSLYKHDMIVGEEGEVIADVLYLKVLHMYVDEAVKEGTHILAEKLSPISRLAGADYSTLGKMITLERPDKYKEES